MENIETKELKTAFYATFSQGFFATLTFSMFMVNSPILFELIDICLLYTSDAADEG